MPKRKVIRKIDQISELKVGDRIAVVQRRLNRTLAGVRIGYVDSFSFNGGLIYVDYRWRTNRSIDLWAIQNKIPMKMWDLVLPQDGQVEIYLTNRSLKHVTAIARKIHPSWKWKN